MSWVFIILASNLVTKVVGGGYSEQAKSLVLTADGGYLLFGNTYSFSPKGLVVKLGATGLLEWTKAIGDDANGVARELVKLGNGFAASFWTNGYGAGLTDIEILKLDPSFNVLWAKTYGGSSNDYVYKVLEGPDGSLILVGYTYSWGLGVSDVLVIKVDSLGNRLWARTLGDSNDDQAFSGAITTDGGIVVVGYSKNFGSQYQDALVAKFDQSGQLLWAKLLSGPYTDEAYAVTATSDGGCAVLIQSTSFGAGNYDFLLAKLDQSGNLEWAKAYGTPRSDYPTAIIQTSDGGFVLAGYTSTSTAYLDILVFKVTSTGSIQWETLFSGDTSDYAHALAQSSDGSFVIAGATASFYQDGTGDDDFFLLVLDSGGGYSGCAVPASLSNTDASLQVINVSAVPRSAFPSVSTPSTTSSTPSPYTVDACSPLFVNADEESCPERKIVWTPVNGGIAFMAEGQTKLFVYAADGRLVKSVILSPGRNVVELAPGLYVWKVGGQMGKALVK